MLMATKQRKAAIVTALIALLAAVPAIASPAWSDLPVTPGSDGAHIRVEHGKSVSGSASQPGNSTDDSAGVPTENQGPIECANANGADLNQNDACLPDEEPADDAPPGPAITAIQLAERATGQIRLPKTSAEIRPMMTFEDGTRGGITGLPMWLWVDADRWNQDLRARVEAGPAWVEAEARPLEQVWDFGDGNTITCHGPGTPYQHGMDALEGSPDCGHKYTRTSQSQSNGAYTVRVSVVWQISWVGSGNTAGELEPIYMSDAITYTVKQARAQLVSPPGG